MIVVWEHHASAKPAPRLHHATSARTIKSNGYKVYIVTWVTWGAQGGATLEPGWDDFHVVLFIPNRRVWGAVDPPSHGCYSGTRRVSTIDGVDSQNRALRTGDWGLVSGLLPGGSALEKCGLAGRGAGRVTTGGRR
jgi:hypothetical protein